MTRAIRTAKQLIEYLAACTVCGQEHKPWGGSATVAENWGSKKDGHAYRTRLFELGNVADAPRVLAALRQEIRADNNYSVNLTEGTGK